MSKRDILTAGLSWVAPLGLLLQRLRQSGVIFAYHRVSPGSDAAYLPLAPEIFAEHCEIIKRSYTVLPLEELVARWRSKISLKGCCAITFDDGYRDFLDHAYPILRSHSFPVTHFVVTDCVERGIPPWTYRANRLLHGAERELSMRELSHLPPATRETKLRQMGDPQTRAAYPPMLSVDDIRALSSESVDFGCHTATHAYLNRTEEGNLEVELSAAKARLEEWLGRSVRYLAYPDGFFDDRVRLRTADAGFEAAFTVGQRELTLRADAFALPRIDVTAHPSRMLILESTGMVEALRRRARFIDR